MKGVGGECRVPSELMVVENHEFELNFLKTQRRKILVNTPDESTLKTL